VLPQLLDDRGQGLSVDELHGIVMHAVLAADGEDRHDAGVVQVRRGPRLVVEALELPRVERRRERQHLERHAPSQGHLLGLVDDPHAPLAELAHDPEVANPLRKPRLAGMGVVPPRRRGRLQG
jgi:hypothetical protein